MERYSFATNLKKERTNRGVTQHELADGIGVKQNTVSAWENAERYPTIDHMYDIANYLKIPVTLLVSEIQKKPCKVDCTQNNKNF